MIEKLYRRKFILEDGRRTYASKRGEIVLKTWDVISAHSNMADLAYREDLLQFGSATEFKSSGTPFVRVVGMIFEPESWSIDSEAYVGGTKA